MKKLLSTKYNPTAHSVGLLLLRLGIGILLAHHGYGKFEHYNEMKPSFMSILGLSPSITLALVIFSELFCSVLVILGLFTRIACIPIIIMFLVIIFKIGHADFFAKDELPSAYIIPFIALLFTGPGKGSIDNMISR